MPIRTIHGGSPQALRESNKRLLLERLLEAPEGLTRPELARSLNLTVTAITNLVAGGGESLTALLDESPAPTHAQRATSGPVPKVVQLKPNLGYVVGIALSHTRVELALADLAGNFDPERDKHSEPWDVAADLHGALAYAAMAANRLAGARGVDPEELAAIGLSIAAPVNVSSGPDPHDRRGLVRFGFDFGAPLPWANVDPIVALTNHLAALPDGRRWSEVELHVDNDANLGALAELKLGAARGKQNIFYIHIDEAGLGAGLVFNGVNYRGAGGIAGELGHVVLEPDRPEQCQRCGRPCVEAIVLSTLGCRRVGSSDVAPLDQIVRAALDADETAIAAIQAAGDYLGRAIAPFVTVLNLDRVLIGGPFPAQAYSLIIPPIQAAVSPLALRPASRDYVLELGALQQDASLTGAIWLALERTRLDYLLRRATRAAQPSKPPEPDETGKLARADA